jgi:2-polyprenyl-3-methyl-5-hydroxy-6-metoxy-1,4-benzoquinol methylase
LHDYLPPLDNRQRTIELIGEITGETHDVIFTMLVKEEKDLGIHHREAFHRAGLKPHVWDQRLEDFYRLTATWFPSHITWNRSPEKLKVRSWIGNFLASVTDRALTILVVGDGAGFDSLYLSMCGHQVTYYEPSGPCNAFARKIFADARQSVRVVSVPADLEPANFDVVVCLDVLEHHPRVPEFVGELAGDLRPGGVFIVSAPFFFVTHHNPTHLLINLKYSGDLARLYKPHGLKLVDGRFFWNPLVLQKQKGNGQNSFNNLPWKFALWLAGILLSTGRYWPLPHNWIAARMMNRAGNRPW